MKPFPPIVSTPISECSKSIMVTGQLTGAVVKIFANDEKIAEGTAKWSHQWFSLFSGVKLNVGDSIVAVQEYNNESSEPSSLSAIVQSAQPVGPILFVNPLFQCSQIIEIACAVPGSHITIKDAANPTIPIGDYPESINGEGIIHISSIIAANEVLIAHQDICNGILGIDAFSPKADPIDSFLLPPEIEMPLKECDRGVGISNVIPGALVTLESTMRPTASTFFYESSMYFGVDSPLKYGEVLSVKQEFSKCEKKSGVSKASVNIKFSPVPPKLIGNLCAGSIIVKLEDLSPGSKVQIFSNGISLGIGEAHSKSQIFEVPPLNAGEEITAQQESCDVWSGDSNRVTVSKSPVSSDIPVINEPLYDCGTAVHVNRVAPGSSIYIHSQLRKNAVIGKVYCITDNNVDVSLDQVLLANDKISAEVILCDRNKVWSGEVIVNEYDKEILPAPIVGKLTENMNNIPVYNIIPGSIVDVYIENECKVSERCSVNMKIIHITNLLKIGREVKVRQRLCSKISSFSNVVVVAPLPPVAKFKTEPNSGNAPLTVKFINEPTGYSGVNDNLYWDFNSDGHIDSKDSDPTFTYKNAGTYKATLTVSNAGGSDSATASISVFDAPCQLPDLVDTDTRIEPDFPKSGQSFTVYFSFYNSGKASTGDFTVRLELDGGVQSSESKFESLPPGASNFVEWKFPKGLSVGDHYIYAYIDRYNNVTECNEANNLGYNGFEIWP